MNAVIYARYSSSSQREASIEEQIKVCKEYAKKKGYIVVDTYSDSAMSGKNDNRPALQKLIMESSNKKFDAVITLRERKSGNLK